MKSFSGVPTERLVIPSGNVLPQIPKVGEVFHLNADILEHDPMRPWFPRGLYVFGGYGWDKLNDILRQRKANVIGSQVIEFDKADVKATRSSTTGTMLTSVTISPSNRRTSFSGNATLWIDASVDGHAILVVWRGTVMVGLAVQAISPDKTTTMAISFVDAPQYADRHTYELRAYFDVPGLLYINQSAKFLLDGAAQTAMIVEENT